MPEYGELTVQQVIDIAIQRVKKQGPARVIIDEEMQAHSAIRALRSGVVYEWVFVRDDGWTLGASDKFADGAAYLWRESWIGVLHVLDDRVIPFDQWQRERTA